MGTKALSFDEVIVDTLIPPPHKSYEEEMALRVLPKLQPPYRKSAQLYVKCFNSLYLLLAERDDKSWVAPYMVRYLHEDRTIAFNFIIALELAGFMKRTVKQHPTNNKYKIAHYTPTPLLLGIMTSGKAPESLTQPVFEGEEFPAIVVRRGIAQDAYKGVVKGISQTVFEVNHFITPLLKLNPEYDKDVKGHRATQAAAHILDRKFRFGYFLDSRGRIYVTATNGINTQGADFEKAMCLPTFRERLSPQGFLNLLGRADTQCGDPTLTTLPLEAKPAAYAAVATSASIDTRWLAWEEPYVGIAACQLIKQYINNPEEPINAFVERDGKCSGLQHWSALLRTDAITNRLGMEIEPAEDGMDIYEYVGDAWKQTLPEEYKKYGVRKSAKKPVMTFAYSATRQSAMEYIADLYKELDRSVAFKLGSNLFDVSNKILEPMVEGVDWLKECVSIISAKGHTDIQWVTPDGFIARQSKYKTEYTETEIVLKRKKHTVKCKDPILVDGKPIPNVRKAQLSIGPNIIHSLDATHLRMVAARLETMGIPAIWVHDSFAVHANYIDILDKVIRQEFIAMYSKDIMNEIRDYWMEFYKVDLPETPKLGNWCVDKIEFCPKFFS